MHVVTELFARDIIDELVLIPAGQPWMRDDAPIASAQDRLEMARIAVAQLPHHTFMSGEYKANHQAFESRPASTTSSFIPR